MGVHDVKHVSYTHVLCGEESDICADGKYVCVIPGGADGKYVSTLSRGLLRLCTAG